MQEDGETAAYNYYTRIITPEDTQSLKFLVSNFHRTPSNVSSYLHSQCRDVRGLDAFFNRRPDMFFVENKRVAIYDDDLEEAKGMAVEFFTEKLKQYSNPVDYMDFKKQHIDEADDKIASFIARFYPGDELKHFFKSRPAIFVVHNEKTIFLINVESVRYFKKRHKLAAKNGILTVSQLRGHTGQAPPHIQKFINTYYLGRDFQNFLWQNDDVFRVSDNGNVSLI